MTKAEINFIHAKHGGKTKLTVSSRNFAWSIITAFLGENAILAFETRKSARAGYDIYKAKDSKTYFDLYKDLDCTISDLNERFEITFSDTGNSYNIWIEE